MSRTPRMPTEVFCIDPHWNGGDISPTIFMNEVILVFCLRDASVKQSRAPESLRSTQTLFDSLRTHFYAQINTARLQNGTQICLHNVSKLTLPSFFSHAKHILQPRKISTTTKIQQKFWHRQENVSLYLLHKTVIFLMFTANLISTFYVVLCKLIGCMLRSS